MKTPTSKRRSDTRLSSACVTATSKAGYTGLFIGVLILCVALAGCQARRDQATRLVVGLQAITPQNISLTNQKLHLTVDILNPGPGTRVLAHVIYNLTLDGEPFVAGRIQGLRTLEPGQIQRVRLPGTTDLEGLGQLLVARRNNAPFVLSGYIVRAYTPGKFRFEHSGLMGDLNLKPAPGAKPGL